MTQEQELAALYQFVNTFARNGSYNSLVDKAAKRIAAILGLA